MKIGFFVAVALCVWFLPNVFFTVWLFLAKRSSFSWGVLIFSFVGGFWIVLTLRVLPLIDAATRALQKGILTILAVGATVIAVIVWIGTGVYLNIFNPAKEKKGVGSTP